MWKYLKYMRNSKVNSSLFKHLKQQFLASLTCHIELSWVQKLCQLQWPQQNESSHCYFGRVNAIVSAYEYGCNCFPLHWACACKWVQNSIIIYATPHALAWYQFSSFTCPGASLWLLVLQFLQSAVTSQSSSDISQAEATVYSVLWDVGLCHFRTEEAGVSLPPGQGYPNKSVTQVVAEGAVAAAPIVPLHPAPTPTCTEVGREHQILETGT